MALTFEWDTVKAEAGLAKHGVSFEEAATVLGDRFSVTVGDPDHDEHRYVTIGQSWQGRTLVVAHADRGDNVRIISARMATRNERRIYEERP